MSSVMHSLEKRVLLPEDLKPINSLDEYIAIGGLKGLERAKTMSSEEIIAEVKQSALRGRGGAGFPSALKWQTVYEDPAPNKYVVCNFAEGEPGTFKDRYLVSKNPYVLFEGLLIIAHMLGAKEAVIGTKKKFVPIVQRIHGVLQELENAKVVEPGFIRIVLGPDEYLFGEEKALLEVIDGRDAMPRLFPPYMVGIHVTPTDQNPTIVNNVESMSHVTHIIADGPDKWKENGFDDTRGTSIITLSGDVKNEGMYEIPLGITVKELLYEIGGGPKGDKPIKAVFSGVSNRVMTPDQFDLQMGFGTMREQGVGLGSGGFIVYDESRSMLDVAWMFSHFLAKSSCGQCIPCNMGTRVITELLKKLKDGVGTKDDLDAIIVETGRCTNQTRCFLPVQESILIPSLMEKFPDEFDPVKMKMQDFDHSLVIPKIQSFDEEKHKFVFEKNPKEFQ